MANNNINNSMESNNFILGLKISKFSLIAFLIILCSTFLFIFLPIYLKISFISGIITFGIISVINFSFTYKFWFMDNSIYQTFYLYIKYKIQIQKISSDKLIKNNIIYENGNIIAFIYEKQLIFKSLHKISLKIRSENSHSDLENAKSSLLKLFSKNNEIRTFSFNLSFDVDNNIDFINKLIKNNINFSEKNIKNDKSLFLIQQMSYFSTLKNSAQNNQLNIYEFSMSFPISVKQKEFSIKNKEWESFLNNFLEEYNDLPTFSTESLTLKNLTKNEIKNIKEKLYFLNENQEITFGRRNIIFNDLHKSYKKYLKLSSCSYILEPGWIRELFNNPFNYNISLVFHSLNEKDENKIINQINEENQQNQNNKKRESRSKKIRKQLNAEVLEDMIFEIEASESKSKAVSLLVEISGVSHQDLIEKSKIFKRYYKKERFIFNDLLFCQKQAFFDFHLGIENKFTKRGNEKKYHFESKKYNNINNFSLWMTANTCAAALPFNEEMILENNSFYLGNDIENLPVAINIEADRPNHHIAIFGKSGSGKTTATEMILKEKMLLKDKKQPLIIIIDPKPEYSDLVLSHNGQCIDLSEGFLNPFLFEKDSKSGFKETKDFLELFLKSWLKDLPFVSEMMIIRILNLIDDSESFKENKLNFDILYKLISEDQNIKSKLLPKEHDDLCEFINQYTINGRKSTLFNNNLTLNYESKIISFNFSKLIHGELSSDSKTLIFVVIYFLGLIMKKNDPKYHNNQEYDITFLVDEFHLLVNSNDTSILKYFDMLYALSRSYGVGIITIFQNLQILNNPSNSNFARSIFANTSYFLIFQLDKNNLDILTQLLPEHLLLSERESHDILNAVKHRSLAIYDSTKKMINWELGVFYDPDRDKNTDGRKEINLENKKVLIKQINEVFEIKQKEAKNEKII